MKMKASGSFNLAWMWALGVLFLWTSACLRAEIQIVAERNDDNSSSAEFNFQSVPRPAIDDAAAGAKFIVLDGRRDPNGGGASVLNDGRLPGGRDQPASNFFFSAGTEGGRLLVELEGSIKVKGVRTYSWHANTRGPQVYRLYGAEGASNDFNDRPSGQQDLEKQGWTLIAKVDTRPQNGSGGGQHGVAIGDSSGFIGTYRYLLFDISRTEDDDPFGNTFYSEIDVIDHNASEVRPIEIKQAPRVVDVLSIENGKYEASIDTSETPDLTEWSRREVAPMVQEWYPKIVAALPSEGFEAPARFRIVFSADMRGVAATGGDNIRCAADWFRRNLEGEAVGAIYHELVHVVQQYRRARRGNPDATRTPGWLVEGIADYLRWFQFEPESRGAEITRRNIERARYDASYRVTANFLDWVVRNHDPEIVQELNAAARAGEYREAIWKERTGRTVQELGEAWKSFHEKRIAGDTVAD